MPKPTAESHPFRVGAMVFRTREAAEAALERTRELLDGEPAWADYRDGLVLRTYAGEVI